MIHLRNAKMEDEVHQASFLEYFLALISLSLSLKSQRLEFEEGLWI